MNYLASLTPEQREALMRPSRSLNEYRVFAAAFRKQNPKATGNEVQHAYQMSKHEINASRAFRAIATITA